MKLVSEWKTVFLRSATTWVTAIVGALVGALAHTYGAAFAILPFLPSAFQLPVAAGLGVIVIGGPIVLARLTDQPKMAAKVEQKAEEHRDGQ